MFFFSLLQFNRMEGSGSACTWEGRRSEHFALSKRSLILSTPHWDVKASDIYVAGQVSPGAQSCTQRSAVCERKSIRALPGLSAPLYSHISLYSVCTYAKSAVLCMIIPPMKAITVSEQWKGTSITKATERAFIARRKKYRQTKYFS